MSGTIGFVRRNRARFVLLTVLAAAAIVTAGAVNRPAVAGIGVDPSGFSSPLGITASQTALVTAVNLDTKAVSVDVAIFRTAQPFKPVMLISVTLAPGEQVSIECDGHTHADHLVFDKSGRDEIFAALVAPKNALVLGALEIFDNDTGKTTVVQRIGPAQ